MPVKESEGRRTNASTGIKGDWSGTVFESIFVACGFDDHGEGEGTFADNIHDCCVVKANIWSFKVPKIVSSAFLGIVESVPDALIQMATR